MWVSIRSPASSCPPAGSSPIDLTEAVTVAGRVSAVVDVVAGRVAVSRLQVVQNDAPGRSGGHAGERRRRPGLVPARRAARRPRRRHHGREPLRTETAEVDLEIVADGDVTFDPVLLTIRPGRSVQVPLADETRLEGVDVDVDRRALADGPVRSL